jgi:flagellar biosynthetic protein FliP
VASKGIVHLRCPSGRYAQDDRKWTLTFGALALFFALVASPALAQSVSMDLGDSGGSATARMIQMILLLTVLSLAPSLLVMVTSFTRIIIVLSFVRSAMGVQNTPPNQVLVALALFLTAFIMTPTFQKSYEDGVLPLIREEISEEEGIKRAAQPFHTFMLEHVREKDLALFIEMMPEEEAKKVTKPEETPYQALIPAFMISELKRAFEIGFLIYIPFLVIDMLIASILMAMGMMMLPPVVISLPFKIIFFVLVDGWYMIAGSMVRSFGVE